MHKYKICVYAICKNEEKFVDRWMDSMREADLVVVTDTGSEDSTAARLRERGAIVYEETIVPWRFDTARNYSLSHVPEDMDIAVCTDLDEIFRPGWRQCLEDVWEPDATMGNYLYNWSLKADGTPGTQFTYFKIHKKALYEWACPVHEYLRYKGSGSEKKVFIHGMVLDHYPDPEKSRKSYLPLLEMAVQEEPENDRMTYYLGREYMYVGRWQECITTLKRHLKLPTAWWPEERCASMRWIAKSYHHIGDNTKAYCWYYRAIAEVPHMRDPYIEFAKLAYLLHDWSTVLYLITAALKIKEKSRHYVNMGYSWDHTPDDLGAIACYYLGMYERSLHHAQNALTFSPDDERLQKNLVLIRNKCKEIGISEN
ncbi:Glycosyltransferase involved in cell wall bisynthesis [Lachnospiraceae bacterium NLAE-zl-G231]|nr:Glycosyltransferase involved in cell wall bisynthesis [Lachnospiraceae bacterium NLAE-zl-G231]